MVVKDENRLGEIGGGFKIAMGAFDTTRPLVAAGAVGKPLITWLLNLFTYLIIICYIRKDLLTEHLMKQQSMLLKERPWEKQSQNIKQSHLWYLILVFQRLTYRSWQIWQSELKQLDSLPTNQHTCATLNWRIPITHPSQKVSFYSFIPIWLIIYKCYHFNE